MPWLHVEYIRFTSGLHVTTPYLQRLRATLLKPFFILDVSSV